MPAWGGRSNDTLLINNGLNNLIYGGGGANTFKFDTTTTGESTIMGFNPAGGDFLDFQGATYFPLIYPEGIRIGFTGATATPLVVILVDVFTFNDDWVVTS